jgi:type VI secretion system secreted protein VgrG
VETTGGDYAHLDEEGRYRARLHYDLGDASEGAASKRIRMSQPYTGPNYGLHLPGHAGAEMLVGFVNGDPDRPMALGTAPNPTNRNPVTSGNRAHNLLRTWAGNELLMDDTKDQEQVRLQTPDLNALLLDDRDDRVVLKTTKGHTLTLDDRNEKVSLATTGGHTAVFDDAKRSVVVTSKDGHQIAVDDPGRLITIRDASENHSLTIDIGREVITIKTTTGSINLRAPKGAVDIQAKSFSVKTTEDSRIQSRNVTVEAKANHTTRATNIAAEAKMVYKTKGQNVSSEAGQVHRTKGLNVSSEAGAQQRVKGQMVNVEAAAVNTIKGGLVKIN